MTSDPTTLNSEVGIGSYLLWYPIATSFLQVLSGLSSDVTRTCDQFLSSLQECMDLSISAHPQPLGHALKPLPLKELYAPKKGGCHTELVEVKGHRGQSSLFISLQVVFLLLVSCLASVSLTFTPHQYHRLLQHQQHHRYP